MRHWPASICCITWRPPSPSGFHSSVAGSSVSTSNVTKLHSSWLAPVPPLLPVPLQGKEGVRQMIRMAPVELVQTPRDELVDGKNVKITTLTRAPGIFANYTTWNFEIDGSLVRRLDFELRAAN